MLAGKYMNGYHANSPAHAAHYVPPGGGGGGRRDDDDGGGGGGGSGGGRDDDGVVVVMVAMAAMVAVVAKSVSSSPFYACTHPQGGEIGSGFKRWLSSAPPSAKMVQLRVMLVMFVIIVTTYPGGEPGSKYH